MKRFYNSHRKEIDQLLVFIAAIVIISLFVKYVAGYFAPFILAFALSFIISKPVDYISKKTHIPRAVTTLFSMVVVLTVLGRVFGWLIKLLSEQLLAFTLGFPAVLDKAVTLIGSFRESFDSFFEFFPYDTGALLDQTIATLIPAVTSSLGNFARTFSVSTVKAIPTTFVFIIITMVSTFFMTYDKAKILSFMSRQLPDNVKKTAVILKTDIFGALWGYIRAQLILMCFSGTIAIAGLTFLGYSYSLLIGLTIAFFDALPIFGPGFILWPWAAFSALSGEYSLAVGLLIIYLTITFCRQMLESKVLSAQIGLYPLVTLIALYVGLMVFGPLGLIVGPLLAIVIRSLQNAELLPNWK